MTRFFKFLLCPGGYSSDSRSLVGGVSPGFLIPETCHFPHPFSDLASKIHLLFHTNRCGYTSFVISLMKLGIRAESQVSSNDVFWSLFFLYDSFGVQKTNLSYALVIPLKTIPDFVPE